MNQRLVWNFEFCLQTPRFPSEILVPKEVEPLKWEIRFFWPDDQPIILSAMDNSLLDLASYRQKHRDDCYYLVPDTKYNIKRRKHQLLYKPVLKQSTRALGFGAKINIELSESPGENAHLHELAQRASTEGKEISVRKEALIYKFPTIPTVKLELARLEVNDKIYFSACIEGKSLELVELIAGHLLDEAVSCDYVTFLNNIIHT